MLYEKIRVLLWYRAIYLQWTSEHCIAWRLVPVRDHQIAAAHIVITVESLRFSQFVFLWITWIFNVLWFTKLLDFDYLLQTVQRYIVKLKTYLLISSVVMEESELDSPKTAMINNSVKNILDLKEKYKDLVVRKMSDSELDSFRLKQDELSNDLIPKDTITEFKVKENKEVYCLKQEAMETACFIQCQFGLLETSHCFRFFTF